MISAENRHFCMIFKLIVTLMMLLIFLPAFPAYGLDSNYVISEYNGWIDIDERLDFEKKNAGFDGFLKRIVDEENGCFYMYFSFYDTELAGYDDDNTVISFDVRNDMNSYCFSVNKNGFVNTGADEQENIKLAYNFDNCSNSRCGGEILIGFELMNNTDRKQYNHISCEYSGGSSRTAVLFYDYGLDMYVEPTVMEGSSKASKPEKSTTVRNSDLNRNSNTKNNTETKEKQTKYTPTGTVSRNSKKENSSKFSAGKVYSSGGANDGEKEGETILNEAENPVGIYKMSKTAVIILSIAGVMIASGIAFVISGFAVKNKKRETAEKTDSISE